MGCINKTAFLKPLRKNREQYPLPEYGEGAYVVVQALTSNELLGLQDKYGKNPDSSNVGFLFDVLALSLVDDSGAPLFTDAADCKAGLNVSIPVLESLFETTFRLSGIETKEKN